MSGEAEPSTAKLARALSEVPGMPRDMVQRAVDGYYSDYGSPLAMPELQLIHDLKVLAKLPTTGPKAQAALYAVAERVTAGDFDATREESDAWAASPEGQETFRELAGDAVFGGMVRKMTETENPR